MIGLLIELAVNAIVALMTIFVAVAIAAIRLSVQIVMIGTAQIAVLMNKGGRR